MIVCNLQDLVDFTMELKAEKLFFLSNLDELKTLIYINAQSSTDNVNDKKKTTTTTIHRRKLVRVENVWLNRSYLCLKIK